MSMPDQSSAASEHSIIQQIAGPLATLSDAELQHLPAVDFAVVLRGYDRLAVDAYVKKTTQFVAELQATRSPEGAVRRALERVGEQISGILQRAHDTAEQITAQSRREAEDRLERARQEAAEVTSGARMRVKDLDADADRIWAERQRIVEDARTLARQLLGLAEEAVTRFPAAEEAAAPAEEAAAAEPEASEDAVEPDEPHDAATTVLPSDDEGATRILPPDEGATAVHPPHEPAQGELPGSEEPGGSH
jgi:hypothetical protein